jgi:hypothetical protein
MKGEFSKLPFGRILIAGVVIVLVSTLAVTLVVTGYAFYLAFQVRGAPDQARIGQFAQWISSILTPVLEIILTFFGARRVRRKSQTTKLSSGLFVGILVVLLGILVQYVFGDAFQPINILWIGLILVAGWLGGKPKAIDV